tara:strand:- start:620 stop:874 length:255 start_codon:yes stop_codon:yes gene_type:complete
MYGFEPTQEDLADLLYYTTMCEAQYGGYPCNSCFHTIIEADLGHKLKDDVHEYWKAVLEFRGDYEDLPPRPDLINELYKELKNG